MKVVFGVGRCGGGDPYHRTGILKSTKKHTCFRYSFNKQELVNIDAWLLGDVLSFRGN